MTKKEQLEKLEKRNNELYPIVFVGFKTDKELDDYSKTIQNESEEYFRNLPIIKKLKWELMTTEEQSKKIEIIRKILTKSTAKSQSEILELIKSKIENEGGL